MKLILEWCLAIQQQDLQKMRAHHESNLNFSAAQRLEEKASKEKGTQASICAHFHEGAETRDCLMGTRL